MQDFAEYCNMCGDDFCFLACGRDFRGRYIYSQLTISLVKQSKMLHNKHIGFYSKSIICYSILVFSLYKMYLHVVCFAKWIQSWDEMVPCRAYSLGDIREVSQANGYG